MNKITFAYSLFFISFVVVVVFIMMQVLTATIFQNYASNAEDDILKRKKHEMKGIVAAFQVGLVWFGLVGLVGLWVRGEFFPLFFFFFFFFFFFLVEPFRCCACFHRVLV